MMDCKKILMTALVGTVMALSTAAGAASPGEEFDGPSIPEMSRKANLLDVQGKGVDGKDAKSDNKGVPNARNPEWAGPANKENGQTHMYRNTWNHRNMKRTRYGSTEESPGFEQTNPSGEQVRARSRLAGASHGRGFMDENGDGINDRAPDHDGDGIPNCQDPEWSGKKRDGTGYKHGNRLGQGTMGYEKLQSRGSKKVH